VPSALPRETREKIEIARGVRNLLTTRTTAMKIVCAWCEREGKPAALGEKEPLEDPVPTHSVCPAHLLELISGVMARATAPGARAETVSPLDRRPR